MKEPRKAIMLKHWMSTDSLWYKKDDSRGSLVTTESLSPIWSRKQRPSALTRPNVSTAIGTKMWVSIMAAYLDLLRAAAASAAEPGNEEVAERYDTASKSTTVVSHVRHRPFCHGTNVRTSGRFPSSLINPDDSLVAGTSQCLRAWLTWWWREDLLVLLLQDRPWIPRALINAPQGQVCASQRLRPRRNRLRLRSFHHKCADRKRRWGMQRASHYCWLLWYYYYLYNYYYYHSLLLLLLFIFYYYDYYYLFIIMIIIIYLLFLLLLLSISSFMVYHCRSPKLSVVMPVLQMIPRPRIWIMKSCTLRSRQNVKSPFWISGTNIKSTSNH